MWFPLVPARPRPRRARTRPARRSCLLAVEGLEHRSLLSATVQGTVFLDVNGDGVRDPGEPGQAGQVVYLDQNQNGLFDAGEAGATTDGSGSYQFAGLAAGSYTVAQAVPGGWLQTSPGPASAPGLLGEVSRSLTAPGTYPRGLAWAAGSLHVLDIGHPSDPNDNRVYQLDPVTGDTLASFPAPAADLRDLTFDGTHFWATQAGGPLLRFDASGAVQGSLPSPDGASRGLAWDAGSQRLWVASGTQLYALDPASGAVLASFAAPDTDVLGLTHDGRHLWLNGRATGLTFEIDPGTGQVLRSLGTPHAGTSTPRDLAYEGGQLWLVQAGTTPASLVRFDAGSPGVHGVTVLDGETAAGLDFGAFQLGSVSGRVFHDADQDGVPGAGDAGLEGWRVYLDANANGRFDGWEKAGVTDGSGGYTIGGVRPGPQTVAEDLAGALLQLPHWVQTAPAGGVHAVPGVTSGGSVAGLDFGNYLDRVDPLPTDWADAAGGRLNLYSGLAWFDETGAAQRLYNQGEAATTAASSTRNGFDDWRLPNLSEGEQAAKQQRAGEAGFLSAYYTTGSSNPCAWTSTAADKVRGVQRYWCVFLGDPERSAEAQAGSNLINLAMVRDTAAYVDDGGAGFSTTGTWSTTTGGKRSAALTGYLGDARTAPAGSGDHTAAWTFSGLEAGASYKIAVTWDAASGYATNAPFTVLDGTSALATVAVNQGLAPDDFTVGDRNWEGLGTYTTESGTLTVRLSNLANSKVIADGVRVFRVYPGFPADSSLAAFVESGTAGGELLQAADEGESAGSPSAAGGAGGDGAGPRRYGTAGQVDVTLLGALNEEEE